MAVDNRTASEYRWYVAPLCGDQKPHKGYDDKEAARRDAEARTKAAKTLGLGVEYHVFQGEGLPPGPSKRQR